MTGFKLNLSSNKIDICCEHGDKGSYKQMLTIIGNS
jgi:hypothetical protein